jgi:hypothetical protein
VQRLVVSLFAVTAVTFLVFHQAIDRVPVDALMSLSRPSQLPAGVRYVAEHPGGWLGAGKQFLRLIGGTGQLTVVGGAVLAVAALGSLARPPAVRRHLPEYVDRADGARAVAALIVIAGIACLGMTASVAAHWLLTPALIRDRSQLPSCGTATDTPGLLRDVSLPDQVRWECITTARRDGRPAELRVVQHYNGETFRTYCPIRQRLQRFVGQ